MSTASYWQQRDPRLQDPTRQAILETPNTSSGASFSSYRSNPQVTQYLDTRNIQHQPTPSPLQVSPVIADFYRSHHSDKPQSPTESSTEGTVGSSQSQHSASATDSNHPSSSSSVDRPNALTASETMGRKGMPVGSGPSGPFSSGTGSLSKGQSSGQLRNISSTSSQTNARENSPPSPTSTTTSRLTNTTIRPSPKSMPRTSSIESAISTFSMTTSHSHKSSQDSFKSNPADISHLINTAGSPEAVIHHLLKEKQHSASQNAQLWRLVDKQRALLLGLNQDLENALKDKERYRKKLKEHISQAHPDLGAAKPPARRMASQSPTSSHSNMELPIQGTDSPEPHSQGPLEPSPILAESRPAQPTSTMDGLARADRPAPSTTTAERNPSAKMRLANVSSRSPNNGSAEESNRSLPPLNTAVNVSHPDGQDPISTISPASFTAKRSQQKATPSTPPKSVAASPPSTNQATFSPARKLPPAPLDLRAHDLTTSPPPLYGPDDHSGSEYEDHVVDSGPPTERGRKKTREEDDKEREAAALKEQQDRSRSKKGKGSKALVEPKTEENAMPVRPPAGPIPPTVKALSPDANYGHNFLSAPGSLAGVLTPTNTWSSANVRGTVLSMQPLSPGLPMSPRPGDRPMNSPMPRMPRDGGPQSIASPPLSPRPGLVGLPLSPRAAKQFGSLPPETPRSPMPFPTQPSTEPEGVTHRSSDTVVGPRNPSSQETYAPPESLKIDLPGSSQSKPGLKGFVSEAYPDLLIPPNALPSISIKVTSSWLKPSRNSYLVSKGLEEEPVFTLGISARSDLQELWQVEKSLVSLRHLDHQIKQYSTFTAKLPDRSLSSGQAPAKIDARKMALEKYFETLLDTPMNEKAALVLCHYLSTQVIDPNKEDLHGTVSTSGSPVTVNSEGRLTKEGYLTKRGKNFGGWHVRFFVLDDPTMRYYESPGGSLLGTIKLHNAKIGKPSSRHSSTAPSEGTDENDNQFRHAFLILEPKRKDSNSHVRHVFCAESDAERDAWVDSLLCYVDGYQDNFGSKKPSFSSNDSGSSKGLLLQKPPSKKDGSLGNSPESETFDGTQALSYEDTVAAQPPLVHITPDAHHADSTSPAPAGKHPQTSFSISGPSNGAKIADVGAWGNKPLAAPQTKEKEHKKRSIWGFREKHSLDFATIHPNDSSLSLTQQQYYEQIANVRPVFGMPLAEAVQYCPPRVSEVCLPAVVYRCLEYLVAKDALSEEGIFRLSGSTVVIKGLRDRFNLEGDFDFLADEQYHDVHAVASLLKLYLRELPTSVLTRELHLDFISVLSEFDEKSKKVAAYKILVRQLPKVNWTLIRALSAFLIGIINNSDVNKMGIRNVGIVFAPTLNIPAPVFAMFLTDFDSIFSEEHDEATVPAFEMSITEPLTPEDIRSPRRQMFSELPTPSYHQQTFPNIGAPHEPSRPAPGAEHDVGFIPLQPSYEPPSSAFSNHVQVQQGSIVPGPDYGVISRKPGVNNTKARRRESSMLLMGSGQRKGSILGMRGESVREEGTYN